MHNKQTPAKPEGRMKRTCLYMTTPQMTALQRKAKKDGLTVAEHIRRAVDQYLESQKRKTKS